MGVHPLLLEWHGSVMTTGDTRAVLKEFTDGVDLAELGREFQSVTVLGKERKRPPHYFLATSSTVYVSSWII